MFPLGNVLFPHAQLPLHVFEPRYRALAETCLAGDGEFSVVLIERGSEVGGGDTRFSVGTDAPTSSDVVLDDDPAQAAFEAAAAAPIGPLDAQRLLEIDDAGERLAQLRSLLADQAELLELRLSGT